MTGHPHRSSWCRSPRSLRPAGSNRPLLVAATLLVGVLAGCGSGGASDDARPSGAPTTADTTADSTTSVGSGDDATYLSLGDSYAQGYQPGTDDTTEGFAYLLPELAEAKGYDLRLANYGCGGATIRTFADEPGCPPTGHADGGPTYDEPQLDAAIAYLEAHPGQVQMITLSIGGNDVTGCVQDPDPVACVTDAVPRIEKGLSAALPRLRKAAGDDTVIVGLTYPDVILGAYVAEDQSGKDLAKLSVVVFREIINPMLKRSYEAVGGTFVDITEGTGAYGDLTDTTTVKPYGEIPKPVAQVCELTWFCERQDIHPNQDGYARIADLITEALPMRR